MKFNLFKLRVKFEFKVVDDVAEVPGFILKLFIFNFERDYSLLVVQPLLNRLLKLFLGLFELGLILN